MESCSSHSKHLTCLRVRRTKENLLRDFGYICVGTSYLRVELFIYLPLITGHNIYICIYIYNIYIIIIIIIIISVLAVTKSLCGFVANQVQYNMESAQYLG